ncbi:adenylosuccinate lyase [Thalassococcus sp. CAU 1522]|uniref:Adenylosuccinate lyase n=1 Tax=Thalassococcus arenae TaxID=2851652 RepID=A0ABS6NB54_9RHOB|nr:adenylosuccinate lyase [Thalassococcus arenae]MBV2361256.1 adenylosuccinate lyase [Thalassococcus arenae]
MKIKTLLAAAVLSLSPAVALAYCSGSEHATQTMTCADGMVYDSETNSCKVLSG